MDEVPFTRQHRPSSPSGRRASREPGSIQCGSGATLSLRGCGCAPSKVNQMKHTAVALTLATFLLAGTPVLAKPTPSAPPTYLPPWSCRMMHARRSSLRPCPNPGSTLAPRIPIRRTRLGTHLERRRRANFQTRSPVRGAPGFKVQLDRRGRTVGVGHRGEISAALEFNQASLARLQRRCPGRKRRPRTPCPGPTVTRSPVFVARISLLTKVVHGGKTRATKWHEVQFN